MDGSSEQSCQDLQVSENSLKDKKRKEKEGRRDINRSHYRHYTLHSKCDHSDRIKSQNFHLLRTLKDF